MPASKISTTLSTYSSLSDLRLYLYCTEVGASNPNIGSKVATTVFSMSSFSSTSEYCHEISVRNARSMPLSAPKYPWCVIVTVTILSVGVSLCSSSSLLKGLGHKGSSSSSSAACVEPTSSFA